MLNDYWDKLDCALGDPCDYDHTCKNHRILSDLKHDALVEIEARDREIEGWEAAREYNLSLIGKRNSEITTLNSHITCFEKQIARHEEEVRRKEDEIVALDERIGDLLDTRVEGSKVIDLVEENEALTVKLSRLTAFINDKERAEKVANTHTYMQSLHDSNALETIREDAINDYRAELLEEISHEQ